MPSVLFDSSDRKLKEFSIGSKRVCKLWEKVKGDVRKVFPTKKIFLKAFKKWKIKKTKKKQALGVEARHLLKYL